MNRSSGSHFFIEQTSPELPALCQSPAHERLGHKEAEDVIPALKELWCLRKGPTCE